MSSGDLNLLFGLRPFVFDIAGLRASAKLLEPADTLSDVDGTDPVGICCDVGDLFCGMLIGRGNYCTSTS